MVTSELGEIRKRGRSKVVDTGKSYKVVGSYEDIKQVQNDTSKGTHAKVSSVRIARMIWIRAFYDCVSMVVYDRDAYPFPKRR